MLGDIRRSLPLAFVRAQAPYLRIRLSQLLNRSPNMNEMNNIRRRWDNEGIVVCTMSMAGDEMVNVISVE